jgi:hypothetical protein
MRTEKRQPAPGSPRIDPLTGARIYRIGFEHGTWKTIKEASAIMSTFCGSWSPPVLWRAIAVSKLPSPVLNLFDEAKPLTHWVAEQLLDIKVRVGAEELERRAQEAGGARSTTTRELMDRLAGSVVLKKRQKALNSTDHIGHLPLLIARRFVDGRAEGIWLTKEAAGLALGLNKGVVATAVRVAGLPAVILSAFLANELTFAVGKKLLELAKQKGRDSMVRAVESLPRPFPPTKKLLAMLAAVETSIKTDAVVGTPASNGDRRPLALAAEYAIGKTQGRWSTMVAAEAALGLYKDAVGSSVRISSLPDQVKALFDEDEMSFELGRRLLAIRKSVGIKAMQQHAENIRLRRTQFSNEVILAVLAGASIPARDQLVSVNLVSRRSGSHLRIESPQMKYLVKDIPIVEVWLNGLLEPRIRDLQLLSVGPNPRRRRRA